MEHEGEAEGAQSVGRGCNGEGDGTAGYSRSLGVHRGTHAASGYSGVQHRTLAAGSFTTPTSSE
jgi:hypothetical protein